MKIFAFGLGYCAARLAARERETSALEETGAESPPPLPGRVREGGSLAQKARVVGGTVRSAAAVADWAAKGLDAYAFDGGPASAALAQGLKPASVGLVSATQAPPVSP